MKAPARRLPRQQLHKHTGSNRRSAWTPSEMVCRPQPEAPLDSSIAWGSRKTIILSPGIGAMISSTEASLRLVELKPTGRAKNHVNKDTTDCSSQWVASTPPTRARLVKGEGKSKLSVQLCRVQTWRRSGSSIPSSQTETSLNFSGLWLNLRDPSTQICMLPTLSAGDNRDKPWMW